MNVPTKILIEAINKLPDPVTYPYDRIQIPWMRFPEVFLESEEIEYPKPLTFAKSFNGDEWELT